ncbi:uncharacterized protein LOC111046440 [Nilaparvata lugens]|uniref:uncharacterized protein LOC111046440 n=1 Tax=Nilaparvata lugens TaxID=108931 RepID=UPI00193D7C12|nr:uncharacterized protein LOC111046440 [Nilaparvata lugens]
MLLQCRQSLICLAWLLPALAVALDLNEIDKSLNPRLVGMIFNLYRPHASTKKPPIIVDCDHPGILCQFGSKPLVARPISECNCKGEVPIVTGLEPEKESNGEQTENEGGEAVSPKSPGASTDVPIYKGIVSNMEAVLESGAASASLQYKPSVMGPPNKWSPSTSEDLYQKRLGELPKKYASYYPFSKPVLIDDPDEFDPDFDQGPPFPFFPEMFGPHHKGSHHQFHPYKKQNGPASKPQTSWRQTAKPTSVTSTTKKAVKVEPTTPTPLSKASDKDSTKKT